MAVLNVALLWHMHQPCYRNPRTGVYELPWVRLRAAKDYVHMLEILADYPDVRLTVNWTPVLLEQLDDYAQGTARDAWIEVARQASWSDDDKRWLLQNFFSINWERFVSRYPGYERLLKLRHAVEADPRYLADAFWRDLTVWFNLAWFDPGMLNRDPALRALAERGSGFTAVDLEVVLERQRRAAAAVVPLCRQLAQRQQAELCTSPYHHPILPVLIDPAAAREPSPDLPLPSESIAWPEDARAQVRAAVEAHEARFGLPPAGLWPSEGALSQAVLELLADEFVGAYGHTPLRWVASDEGLLERALGQRLERDGEGNLFDPTPLAQPYRVADGRLAVFFRDRVLSDRIGFVYGNEAAKEAVDDLLGRLDLARRRAGGEVAAPVISIILDGENCWEHYPNNGDDFLRLLYHRLSESADLRTTTFSAHLAAHPPSRALPRLPAGSWIGANLETWIGEPAQNRAWDELARARARLTSPGKDPPPPHASSGPWAALWAAEASDWFWWFYSRNQVGPEHLFDRLFREHLRALYQGLKLEPPSWLAQPILELSRRERIQPPKGPVEATPRAEPGADAQWEAAGWVEPESPRGTMQPGMLALRRLRYGWGREGLALRLEADVDLAPLDVVIQLGQAGAEAQPLPFSLPPLADVATYAVLVFRRSDVRLLLPGGGAWQESQTSIPAALREGVLECTVPREVVRPPQGERLELRILLRRDRSAVETLPTTGSLALACPGPAEEGAAPC